MSRNAKITRAGNKIESFVKLRGGAFGKVDNGVSKSKEALQDADDGSIDYGAAADATVATFEAVAGSIEKFESGDPTQIAIGVLDILAEVSELAALTGPTGEIIAAVVGPLCTIISSLLGAKEEPPESQEDMFKRVLNEALAQSINDKLRSLAVGVQKEMMEKMATVQTFYERSDELTQGDREVIRDNNYVNVGSEFLGMLREYAGEGIITNDTDTAERTAFLISTYASIAYLRCQHLFMLASLYATDPGLNMTIVSTYNTAKSQRELARDFLEFLHQMPDSNINKTYAQVHSKPQSTLDLIRALTGRHFGGRMMTIFNIKQLQYLTVYDSKDPHTESGAYSTKSDNSTHLSVWNKFIVFGLGADGTGSGVEIFSLAQAGYVYASSRRSKDRDRRYVRASNKGVPPGHKYSWTVTRQNAYGHAFVQIEEIKELKEYLYAADYQGNEERKFVYTWKPGNPVSQGYWLFRESYTPSPQSIKYIRSVSSGNYMNGRSSILPGITVWLSDKNQDSYLRWELIKLADGTFNLRSESSDMFLDGRHEGIGIGYHMKLHHISHKDASTMEFFKWRLKEYTDGGRTRHTIQSVSSKLYLNGREPENTGGQLFLSDFDPENDKYFMWDLMNV